MFDTETKYKVVRFYADDRPQRTVKRGLTLEQAQEHCQRDDTHGTLDDGTFWFDGYTEQVK